MTEPTGQPVHEQDGREAARLMRAFAERTHVTSAAGCRHRYLWTDAFAVCNFLALHEATGAPEQLSLARALVERVHEGLGRHRPDDGRSGWLSGLPEEQGRRQPTRAGLRIGKPLPERRPDQPFDEQLEWQRDGQYFHYLTRRIHALVRMAAATRERCHLDWAVDLAVAAHDAFLVTDPRDGRRRMYWKMSVDLCRPVVASQGHHDPLDGLLTCLELRAALDEHALPSARAPVDAMVRDFERLGEGADWTTDDALGIGGLLAGAGTFAQATARGATSRACSLSGLLGCAAAGIAALGHDFLREHAERRLAFRELGLAIGLRAVPRIQELAQRQPERFAEPRLQALIAHLLRQLPQAAAIERFWSDPAHRTASTWTGHRDINEVMLATSLMPDGYLGS